MRRLTAMEKAEGESVCDGPRAVKGESEGLAEGWRMDRRRLALGHVDESVHARMVMEMEMVLTEVKMAIGPIKDGCASIW